MQQCVYETKICDIDDLQKRLMQTWFDFEQNIIDAAIVQWLDRLRSCVSAGGGNFERMLLNYVHLHYVVYHNILWNCQCNFGAFDGYFVVNVKTWINVRMHFRCFNFNKVP